MIFGLKVKTVNGEKLNWRTVLFREWIGRFINNTIPILYFIVAIMPKNKSIADYFADTVVVHENVFVKDVKLLLNKVSELSNKVAELIVILTLP